MAHFVRAVLRMRDCAPEDLDPSCCDFIGYIPDGMGVPEGALLAVGCEVLDGDDPGVCLDVFQERLGADGVPYWTNCYGRLDGLSAVQALS